MRLFQASQEIQQFSRYLVVGAGSNFLGYAIYLAITWAGLDPVMGMTLVYISACLVSFTGNKYWTFADKSKDTFLFPRYIVIQFVGYLTNLLLLLALSRVLGFPHQVIQLLASIVVATELFLLSKYYVFREGVKSVRS